MILQNDYPINPRPAFEGQIIGPLEACDFLPVRNVDAVSIPFSRAVAWKKTGQTSDFDVQLPAAQTDSIAGIVVFFHQYMPAFQVRGLDGNPVTIGQFDMNGIRPGQMFVILRRGAIKVKLEAGCAVDDRLFVRAIVGAAGTVQGGFSNAAEANHMIDCTRQGVFLTSATSAGFAELRVNFDAKP
jgi:hypothetical protein